MKKMISKIASIALMAVAVSCSNGSTENKAAVNPNLVSLDPPTVHVANGDLEGVDCSGVKVFKGVPFAKAPVGELRWKAPQPMENWEGVRKATEFGPNPMQENIFGDMMFSTDKMSEDCLYLNIWTPTQTYNENLPVFIYFNGGGLMCGSGSEPRYAGMTFARNGVIAITANYREGIFGFLAHPELSAETEYKGSGNYGLLDQVAAIQWVKDNIASFGGDPNKITIMGESAGSFSVSALMASPLSRNLIAQAMGSSGSVLSQNKWLTLEEAEAAGVAKVQEMGFNSIAELRALSQEDLMAKAGVKSMPGLNIDNYFMPKQPMEIYAAGEQAHVPCLIGNNNTEMVPGFVLRGQEPTIANLSPIVEEWFQAPASEVLPKYGINEDADIMAKPGYVLAGDMFIAYSTWKWLDMQQATSEAPVYRYCYCHPRPDMVQKDVEAGLAGGVKKKEADKPAAPKIPGAIHSADIEYQMGNLSTNPVFAWNADDYAVSEIFVKFFVNFIKTGNPNGLGLPTWEPINGREVAPVMMIDVNSRQEILPDVEARYRFIDNNFFKK